MCKRRFIKTKEMRQLVDFAEKIGFAVELTKSTHLKFTMPDRQPVFTSSTPSDGRAWLNARSQLRRVANGAE